MGLAAAGWGISCGIGDVFEVGFLVIAMHHFIPVADEKPFFLKIEKLVRFPDDGAQGGGHLEGDKHEDDRPDLEVDAVSAAHASARTRNDAKPEDQADDPDAEAQEAKKYD